MKEKIAKILGEIFAYGLGILMAVVLLVAAGYVIAFIAGLPCSEAICAFIGKFILPYVYIGCIVVCILGVINMCLRGVFVFMLDFKHKK